MYLPVKSVLRFQEKKPAKLQMNLKKIVHCLLLIHSIFSRPALGTEDETQRGCLNSVIGGMILGSSEIGCHEVPKKYGTGTICLCDKSLCNGATTTTVSINFGGSQKVAILISLVFSSYVANSLLLFG